MKRYVFYSLTALLIVSSLLLSSCEMPGLAAPTATSTATLVPTSTETSVPTSTATATFTPTKTPKPTITPNATGTQRTSDFLDKLQEYKDAGYISTTDGTYTYLGDYKDSWSQINYYAWNPTPFSPTDFIITSEISWRSASSAANSSGCGYVFHLQDNADKDHYMFFISLKGYVQMASSLGGNWKSMGTGFYGNPAQNGKANVTLIAEGSVFRVLVNDKPVKTYNGFAGKLATGTLAYTIVSGINTSYGTECQFKNTELWEMKN